MVEGGEGEDEGGFEIEGDGAEVVGGAAEAAELVAEGGFVEGAFLSELEGLGGGDGGGSGLAVAEVGGGGLEREGCVFGAGGGDVELPLFAHGDVAFEGLAEGFVEGGVVSFEDAGAGGEGAHVELAALEFDPVILDDVEAAALFAVGVGGVFEDDAVAGFEGDDKLVELDGIAGELGDGADVGAAFFAEAGGDEFLVIDAVHPAGVEASGEGHFEGVAVGGGDGGFEGGKCGGTDGVGVQAGSWHHFLKCGFAGGSGQASGLLHGGVQAGSLHCFLECGCAGGGG